MITFHAAGTVPNRLLLSGPSLTDNPAKDGRAKVSRADRTVLTYFNKNHNYGLHYSGPLGAKRSVVFTVKNPAPGISDPTVKMYEILDRESIEKSN